MLIFISSWPLEWKLSLSISWKDQRMAAGGYRWVKGGLQFFLCETLATKTGAFLRRGWWPRPTIWGHPDRGWDKSWVTGTDTFFQITLLLCLWTFWLMVSRNEEPRHNGREHRAHGRKRTGQVSKQWIKCQRDMTLFLNVVLTQTQFILKGNTVLCWTNLLLQVRPRGSQETRHSRQETLVLKATGKRFFRN